MNRPLLFANIRDAADQLDSEAQVDLIAILSRRLAAKGREQVVHTVAESRREFAAGECQPMTAAAMIEEALSCDGP